MQTSIADFRDRMKSQQADRDAHRAKMEEKHRLAGHSKSERLYALAWDMGHSYGYDEVEIRYDELADLLKPSENEEPVELVAVNDTVKQKSDPAAKIVEELFSLGDEPNSPTIRLEFKGGTTGNEQSQGGMCRAALVEWMERALVRNCPAFRGDNHGR